MMMALQRLLRTNYRIKPTTPLFVSSRPLPDVNYFQNVALTNHPGLQKSPPNAQAEQLHALSDTGPKPTVMLYGYGQIEKDPQGWPVYQPAGSYGGGLIKLRHWHRAMPKYAKQICLKSKSVTIYYCWSKNWHDVNNAQSRYQALQSNVDLAAEVISFTSIGAARRCEYTTHVGMLQTQPSKRTEQAQAANHYVQSLAALYAKLWYASRLLTFISMLLTFGYRHCMKIAYLVDKNDLFCLLPTLLL